MIIQVSKGKGGGKKEGKISIFDNGDDDDRSGKKIFDHETFSNRVFSSIGKFPIFYKVWESEC